jgi:hypothetical protein
MQTLDAQIAALKAAVVPNPSATALASTLLGVLAMVAGHCNLAVAANLADAAVVGDRDLTASIHYGLAVDVQVAMGQIRRDNVLGRLTGLASQCWRGQRGENDDGITTV